MTTSTDGAVLDAVQKIRAYAHAHHDDMDGATYAATMTVADRVARGDSDA